MAKKKSKPKKLKPKAKKDKKSWQTRNTARKPKQEAAAARESEAINDIMDGNEHEEDGDDQDDDE